MTVVFGFATQSRTLMSTESHQKATRDKQLVVQLQTGYNKTTVFKLHHSNFKQW